MTFDLGRRIKERSLSRTRLNNARAEAIEQGLRRSQPQPQSIIGGQLVQPGDTPGYNAANAMRNATAADANARMSLRGKFGSQNVTSMAGMAGSAAGGTPTELGTAPAADGAQTAAPEGGAPAPSPPPVQPPPTISATPQNTALRELATGGVSTSPAGGAYNSGAQRRARRDAQSSTPVNDAMNAQYGGGSGTPVPASGGSYNSGAQRRERRGMRDFSSVRALEPTPVNDALNNRYGAMYGGVIDKPKMVKQPGYKNGGKVNVPDMKAELRKTPEFQMQLQEAAAAGYWQPEQDPEGDIAAVQRYMFDKDAAQRQAEEQQLMQTRDPNMGMAMGGQIGPEVTKWAGEKKKKKGMRGYAQGGKIGKKSADDGRDTVDVRVREGEYMLNPETVGYMGGGSYEQGVRMLDDVVRQATGQEPGPVPVNAEGEAVRGFRNGGKMGYAQSGATLRPGAQAAAEEARRLAQLQARELERIRQAQSFARQSRPSANVGPQQPMRSGAQPARPTTASFGPAAETVINDTTKNMPKTAPKNTMSGLRGSISGSNATNLSLRPLVSGGRKVVSAGARNFGPIAALAAAGQTAADTAFTPTQDYYERFGLDYGDASTAGELGVRALGAASDLGANFLNAGGGLVELVTGMDIPDAREYLGFRDIGEDGLTARQEAAAAQDAAAQGAVAAPTAAQQAAALDAERAASGQYFRPFGGGEVSLQDIPEAAASAAVAPGGMNIVQRTGGPNNEVIVREDVDGVPTFSNLRTAPQAGDAATLQAQANERVVQDMGVREMQNRVVEQMRQNAPVYGNTEAAQLRDAETAAQQERALAAAESNPNMSLDDLQGEFEALGMFTDPETGSFSPEFFAGFVQQVINPMVEAGQLDPASLTPAQIMQLAVTGQDSMGVTGAVNNALRRNARLPLGGIVTPNMVGPREDASFFGDLGWFNERSDLSPWEAAFGDKRVVQTPDGPIALPADEIGLRTQRQANIYGN